MGKERFETQTRSDDVHVKVRGSEDHDSGQPTTEFIIAPRDGSGDHTHVVIDEWGNTVHQR